jgi:hypothetical protein
VKTLSGRTPGGDGRVKCEEVKVVSHFVCKRFQEPPLHAAYLSVIALAGVGLNAAFGWWWADPVAALGVVPIIAKEAHSEVCVASASKARLPRARGHLPAGVGDGEPLSFSALPAATGSPRSRP